MAFKAIGVVTDLATIPAATPTNIALPIGVSDGDFLLLTINTHHSAANFTVPAGWTNLTDLSIRRTPSDSLSADIYWRFASSEPASYAVETDTSEDFSGVITSWSGIDQTNPFDVVPASVHTLDSFDNNSPTPQPITTVTANAEVVTFSFISNSDITNVVPPSGYTLQLDHTPFDDRNMIIASKVVNTPGVETPGAFTNTETAGFGDNTTAVLALRPTVAADVTAPVISTFTQGAITSTTSTGTITTDDEGAGAGLIHFLVNTSSTISDAATLKADSATLTVDATLSTSPFSLPFTGLSPSTGYYYHVVQTDTAGNDSNVISSTIFNTSAPAMQVTAITSGTLRTGDTATLTLTNATSSGKTLSVPAGSITAIAQSTTEITFNVPDPKDLGTKVTPYSQNITLTVTDGSDVDTITFVITPDVGYDYETITSVGGIYLDDIGLAIGDQGYGHFTSGSGTADLATGNISPTTYVQYEYWVRDDTDGVWSDPVTEIFVDPARTSVVIASPDTTDASVLFGATGSPVVDGDKIYYDSTTSPDGIGVTVAATGVWTLASMPTVSQTFTAYAVTASGLVGDEAIFTFSITADTTAPILSLPTGASSGSTTATGSITTDEGNGNLYYLISANVTELAATVKAASTQTVSATGVQSVSFTGLAAGTSYYNHFVHVDDSANESAVLSSSIFTTDAASDTTAPALTSPVGTKTGSNTATGSVTTDEANGTLYYVTSVNTSETAATIKLGTSQSVTSTGVQSVSFSGLVASTAYYNHFVHRDAAGNDSAVSSSSIYTTDAAADTTAPILTLVTQSATGANTATVGITTDEANGTLYLEISTTSTPLGASVIKSGSPQVISSTGAKTFNVTGLATGTTYYANFIHTDAAGNNSNIVTSPSFTTDATDTVEPDFVNGPYISAVTETTATVTFEVTEAGSYRIVLLSNGATKPTATQVLIGQDASGSVVASNLQTSLTVMASGSIYNETFTGLTDATSYNVYIGLTDSAGNNHLSGAQDATTLKTLDAATAKFTGILQDWQTGVAAVNATGLQIAISDSLGGDTIGNTVTFTTDSLGAFSVSYQGAVVGTEYYCSLSNSDGSITELHKMTAEAV